MLVGIAGFTAARAQDPEPTTEPASSNIVAALSGDATAITILINPRAPTDGLNLTVGLSCDAASGVSVDGAAGAEVRPFTVTPGDDPASVDDDDIRDCARVWEVTIAARESEVVFAPQIAASAAGRLIEFFLADPGNDAFLIDDSARYIAVVRGLRASFAADNPRVVVEGQSAMLTIALSGAADFPGAAVSVSVADGGSADPADYALVGLSGGRIAVAEDASEAVFTVNPVDDSVTESAGEKIVPHETAIFEITDSRGSGFAVGDSGAAMTLLIADAGAHSTIAFDSAGADAAEGDEVILSLSFNALPIGFRITLTGADAAYNGDWSFVGGGCATLPAANQCVIEIAADVIAAEVAVAVAADGEAELAEEFGLTLLGDAPPGYVWGGDFMLTIAVSDVNAVDGAGDSGLMRAVRAGDADAVAEWIAVGADATLANNAGETALDLANALVESPDKTAILALLIDPADVPQDLTATAAGGGASERVVLAWETAAGATGYKVYHGLNLEGGAALTVLADAVAETTWTHEGALPGTHTYAVAAVKAGADDSDMSAQAEATVAAGICERTLQVRDGIVAAIDGVSDCAAVTAAHLAGISGEIDIRARGITTLQPGDFSGLGGLDELDLSGNGLTLLPAGVFSGLDNLNALDLNGNDLTSLPAEAFSGLGGLNRLLLNDNNLTSLPAGMFSGRGGLLTLHLQDNPNTGDSLDLTLRLARTDAADAAVGPAMVRAALAEGAPFEITVGLSANGGSLSAANAIIPVGALHSGDIVVTYTGEARISISATPALPADHQGYQLVADAAPLTFGAPTALLEAAAIGDAAGVEDALDNEADPNAQNGDGDTALDLALGLADSVTDKAAIIDAIIAAGGRCNNTCATDDESEAALRTAAAAGDAATLMTLLARGVNPDAQNADDGNAALHLAAAAGYAGIVDALIAADADVALQNGDGDTALHLAAAGGYAGIVDALLAAAADVGVYVLLLNNGGMTALDLAMRLADSVPDKAAIIAALGAVGPDPAAVPEGLATATSGGGARENIVLTWNPADLADGYKVYHRRNNGALTVRAAAVAGTTWTHQNAVEGTHTYAIAAFRVGALDSARSAEASAAVARGICARTEAVRNGIVARISGVSDCNNVTAAHLRDIGETLDLASRGITTMQSIDFSGFGGVTKLDLSSNQISELSAEMFSGLDGLTELVLFQNSLTSLPAGVFSELSGLTDLNLNLNSLNELSRDMFAGLDSLVALRLSGNRVPSLPAGVFAGLGNLEILILSSNQLTSLPPDVFAGLGNLEILILNQNFLSPVHSDGLTPLPANVFSDLGNLEQLYLHTSSLTSLPVGIFSGLSDLETLFLHTNDLTSLPAGAFSGLSGLVTLSLEDNPDNGDSLDLTLRLARTDGDAFAAGPAMMRAELAEGAPFEIAVGLSVTVGALAAAEVTIPAGALHSESVAVTFTDWARIAISATPNALPADHSGYRLVAGPAVGLAPTGVLRQAAATGDADAVDDALTNGADPNALADNGTALHLATAAGHAAIVDALITANADVDLQNNDGNSALHLATAAGNAAIVDALIAAEADVTLQNAAGQTALELALRLADGDNKDAIIAALIAAGGPAAAVPTGLTASASGGGASEEVTLRWDPDPAIDNPDPAADDARATGYKIYHGLDGATPLTLLATLAAEETTWTHEDAPPGTHAYAVAAVKVGSLDSEQSEQASVTIAAGICGRTEKVKNAILAEIRGVTDCAAVTAAQLARIRGLVSSGHNNGLFNLTSLGITALQPGDFSGLSGVTELRLNGNRLTSLPMGVFSGLSGVTILRLNGNRLTSLPMGVFSELSGLKILDLASNNFDPLSAEMFSELSGLEELQFDGNGFTSLPAGLFSELSGLITLRLWYGELNSLSAGVFSGLGGLEYLDLRFNDLATLPPNAFAGLSGLKVLDLSSNPWSALPPDAFAGLGNLESLLWEHSNNPFIYGGDAPPTLTSLPAGIFSGLGSLLTLDLISHGLTELPAGIFSGLGNLERLRFFNNDLETLPAGIFAGLNLTKGLVIHDNPNQGDDFDLTVRLARTDDTDGAVGPAMVRAELAEGAPIEMTVGLSATGGALAAAEVTIPVGALHSESVEVTYLVGAEISVSETPDDIPNIHAGFRFVAGPPLIIGAVAGLLGAVTACDADAAANSLLAGVDPNEQNDNGDNALDLAFALADCPDKAAILTALIADGGRCNNTCATDDESEAALRTAAADGAAATVMTLLAQGVNPNSADDDGNTALHLAAQNGHSDAVAALAAAVGVNVNAQNNALNTPLDDANVFADTVSRPFIRDYLLDAGGRCYNTCDLLNGDPTFAAGEAELRLAVTRGYAVKVATLLSQGINPNAQDDDGNTALDLANGLVDGEKKTAIRAALLAAGGRCSNACDATAGDPQLADIETELLRAAINGDADAITALLRQGVNPNARDKDGTVGEASINLNQTALHYAAGNLHIDAVEELLKANGIEINARSSRGNTALHFAADGQNYQPLPRNEAEARRDRTEVVRRLLAADGVDVNAKNAPGTFNGKLTPLFYAALYNHPEVVALLLTVKGIDVNAQSTSGRAAMMEIPLFTPDNELTTGATGEITGGDKYEVLVLLLGVDGIEVNAQIGNQADGNTVLDEFNVRTDGRLLAPTLIAAGGRCRNNCRAGDPHLTAGEADLRAAARDGDDATVATLIGLDINPNAPDDDGNAALHLAAQNGHITVVNTLLAAGDINVNLQNNNGDTALHLAAQNGYTAIAEALLADDGVNVNLQNNNGDTPLHLAAQNDYAAIATALIAADGVNVNLQNNDDNTALHLATQNGYAAIATALLADNGVDVNLRNDDGDTALHLAAQNGYAAIATALLADDGVDVNLRNDDGNTALHLAAQNGYAAIATALLAVDGVYVSPKNNRGDTPLDLANALAEPARTTIRNALGSLARCNNNCAQYDPKLAQDEFSLRARARDGNADGVANLLTLGIDPNARGFEDLIGGENENGNTALHFAARNGHANVVTVLLAAADIAVNIQNSDGDTALDFANALAEPARTTIRDALIAAGGRCNNACDATAGDALIVDGETALIEAAKEGDADAVAAWLRQGINPNARDENNFTALIWAATRLYPAAVKELLKSGDIEINAINNDGRTALMEAAGGTNNNASAYHPTPAIARSNRTEVVMQLLAVDGVDVNLQGNNGRTALMQAALYSHPVVAAELLKVDGIEVNTRNSNGQTALILLPLLNGNPASDDGDTLTELLNADGIEINAIDNNGDTALDQINTSNASLAPTLIAAGGRCNTRCKEGDPSIAEGKQEELRAAAETGDAAAVTTLLNTAPAALLGRGFNPNAPDDDGDTALHLATRNSHLAAINALLADDDILVNPLNNASDTPLDIANALAVGDAKDDIRKSLRDKGGRCNTNCDPNANDPSLESGEELLRVAAENGDIAEVEELLNEGVNPNAPNELDENGNTPLHLAAANGHANVVIALLAEADITVNIQNNAGETALDKANGFTIPDSVTAVRAALLPASIGGRCNNNCRTGDPTIAEGEAELRAAAENGLDQTVATLLSQGIDPNAANPSSYTALMFAAVRGHADVVDVLLQADGINVNAAVTKPSDGGFGRTPLIFAARHGHVDVVEKLLAVAGININAQDGQSYDALILAAQNGHAAVIEKLLEFLDAPSDAVPRDAVIIALGAQDDEGRTALIWAARNGHADAVALLVATGIPVRTADNSGYTPLIWAAIGGHADAATELLKSGRTPVNDLDNGGHTALDFANRPDPNVDKTAVQAVLRAPRTEEEADNALCNLSCEHGDTRLDGTIYLLINASFAGAQARIIVEGQSAAFTIALDAAVTVDGAVAPILTGGNATDEADYTTEGLSGRRLEIADGLSKAAFTVSSSDDSTTESAGANIMPHETVIFEIDDLLGSGFAPADPATVTLLIADSGEHSPIAFDAAVAPAAVAEGATVPVELSFNTLPIPFSITLGAQTPADASVAAAAADWSFDADDCDAASAANQCVMIVAENVGALTARINIADDTDDELVEPLIIVALGAAPTGYHFPAGAQFALTIAPSDIAVDEQDAAGNTGLILAAQAGDAAAVQRWIDSGANVNLDNNNGDTALHFAAQNSNADAANALLAVDGILVNSQNNDGNTALHLAAKNGNDQTMEALIPPVVGILVNAQNNDGDTALDLINRLDDGHRFKLKFQIALDTIGGLCNNTCPTDEDKETELTTAAIIGNANRVQALLAEGVNPNAQAGGVSALSYAATLGHAAVVDLLLAAPGIAVNLPDDFGGTPLSFAAENNHESVVNKLLAADGIAVNLRNFNDRTALDGAIAEGSSNSIIRALLDAGARCNANCRESENDPTLTRLITRDAGVSFTYDFDDDFDDYAGDNSELICTGTPPDSLTRANCALVSGVFPTSRGEIAFWITASDGKGWSSERRYVFNREPHRTGGAAQIEHTIAPGENFSINVGDDFDDLDGDAFDCQFVLRDLPTNLALENCVLSGVLAATASEPLPNILISAFDPHGGIIGITYTLNRRPHRVGGADEITQTVAPGEDFSRDVLADFGDYDNGDTLTCAATLPLPTDHPAVADGNLTWDGDNCELSGVLAATASEPLPGIVITASDDRGGSVDITYHFNRPPHRSGGAERIEETIASGEDFSRNVRDDFDDLDGDTLTCAAATLPTALDLNGCVLSGLPAPASGAPLPEIVITASDGRGGRVDITYNFNRRPQVVGGAEQITQSVTAGELFHRNIRDDINDSDGDAWTCSASPLPASNPAVEGGYLVFDDCAIDGELAKAASAPLPEIVVTADDGRGGILAVTYIFNRHPHSVGGAVNIAHTVVSGADFSRDVGADFGDYDNGDTLTCAATLPSAHPAVADGNLALDNDNCVLSGRLTAASSEPLPGIVITASDSRGGRFDITYTLRRALSAPATRDLAANRNIAFSQDLTGADGFQTDLPDLQCARKSDGGAFPAGLALTGCTLSGTPTAAGDYAFTIIATLPDGTTKETAFTMPINAPVIAQAQRTITAEPGADPFSHSISNHFNDADGDPLNCALIDTNGDPVSSAHGVTVGANCDEISGVYPAAAGQFTVTVVATDNRGSEATVQYTLNRPPTKTGSGNPSNISSRAGVEIQRDLASFFNDIDGDNLRCTFTGETSGFVISPRDNSCVFSITAPNDDGSKVADIDITAHDGRGGSVIRRFGIFILARPLAGPETRLLTGSNPDGGDPFTQNLADADGFVASNAGGALSCALKADSALPGNFQLSGTGACTLSGTMPTTTGAIDSFTIIATEDGDGGAPVETEFTLNRPPFIVSGRFPLTLHHAGGASFSRNLAADYGDKDGDTIHCEEQTPPDGLALSGVGNCTLSGTYPTSAGAVEFAPAIADRAADVSSRGTAVGNRNYEFNRHPFVAKERARLIKTTQLANVGRHTYDPLTGTNQSGDIADYDGDTMACETNPTHNEGWPEWVRLQSDDFGNLECRISVERNAVRAVMVTLRVRDVEQERLTPPAYLNKGGVLDVVITVSVGANPPPTTPDGTVKTLPLATKGVAYPAYDLAGDFADVDGDSFICALKSGNDLPAGLALSAGDNCTLSGTPTATADYTFSIVATDTGGGTAEIAYTLPVGDELAKVSYHFTPSAALAEGGSFAVTISVTDFAIPAPMPTDITLLRSSEQLRFDPASCKEPAPAEKCTVTVPFEQTDDLSLEVMVSVLDDNNPECGESHEVTLQTDQLSPGYTYDSASSNPADGVAVVEIAPSDLDVTDANGNTALIRALISIFGSSSDDADDKAICFAAAGADVNIIGERGYTALHLVAYAGARGERTDRDGRHPEELGGGVSLLDWILFRTSPNLINRIAGPTPPGDGPNLYFTPLDLAATSADNGSGGESGIGIYQAGVDKIKLAGGVCHYQLACDNARIGSTPLIRFSSPNASLTAGESNQLSLNRGANSGLVSVTLAIDAAISSATNSGEWDVADTGDDWHFGAGQCADTSAVGECIITIANGQNKQNFNFLTVADADAGPETVVIYIKEPRPAGYVLGFRDRLTVTINPTAGPSQRRK